MKRRHVFARASLLAIALLQLTLPGAAAWADARLDAAAPQGPIHLESHATQACAPVHPPDCVLHRFLSTPGCAGQPVIVDIGSRAGHLVPPAESRLAGLAPQQRLPDSRAPPPLS